MNVFERIAKLEALVKRITARPFVYYDKGSFSPTLVGAGTAGTFTYGSGNLIEWTRVGNRLHVNGRVHITATAVAPVGNLTINGWPYAGVANTNMAIAGVMTMQWTGINLPANYWSVTLQFANGISSANLIRSGTNNAQAAVAGGELVGGAYDFRFGGNYRVA